MPTTTVQTNFDLALQHHQAGRLQDAEQLYRQILDQQPAHVGALHFLGVIAHQQGQNDIAVDFIRKAITLSPAAPEPHNNLGLALKESGQLDQAIAAYQKALALRPNYPSALFNLGTALQSKRQLDRAIIAYRQAIALRPSYAQAHTSLANLLMETGQHEEAVASFKSAIALDPSVPEVHNNLGNLLSDAGNSDQAIAAYRQALAIKPTFAEAHYNLANALRIKGDTDAAIIAYRQAIALKPDHAAAHNNLGDVLRNKGELDGAIASFLNAIAIRPDDANAHFNLGNALGDQGAFDHAIAAYRRAIALRPSYADACTNLGHILRDNRQLDESIAAFQQAVACAPEDVEACNNLGNALAASGQLDQAITAFRQAIALNPRAPGTYNNMGLVLKKQGQIDESIAAYQQAIACDPAFPEAHNNLAFALYDSGCLDEAISAFRQAIALRPSYVQAHSNLLFALLHDPKLDAAALDREHRAWNDQHAMPLRHLIRPAANDRIPDRRLRIGYVSPDFRDHAVGYNLLPLFHHHDRSQFKITCYAHVSRPDAITSEFQSHADRWRDIVTWSDDRVADQIREDQIDILVDLALHTGNNRLLAFARRPAPVQVTFAGYPGSTGLSAIDYRLSDLYLDPCGMDDSIYSEKTIRLPDSFWCYDPRDVPDVAVNALPALSSGHITFGCLNSFCKINDHVLDLWAAAMRKVPKSRLLLLAPQGSHRRRTTDRLQNDGIDPSRIEFIPRQSRRDYLQAYNRIDIGLDSFPYNGHTTSLDSFWMGVPVVTLVGPTVVSRAGWCQLSNLHLQELAAQTPEQFVNIAVELATDLPRLKALRATLRQRMEQSPLMDAPTFASNIEAAYRQVWRTYCDMSRPAQFWP